MSLFMRDLVKEDVELREDWTLAAMAEEGDQGLDPERALFHEEIWGE